MAYKKRREGYRIVEPSYSTSYTLGSQTGYYARPQFKLTSPTEIRDIAAAIAVLSAAFFWIIYPKDGSGYLYYIGLAALVVFAGFLIHEMSHKFVARRYGCWAEFRADYRMLGFGLLTALFGFLFAAPGAVMIAGPMNNERNGKISLAGPGSNLVVAVLCLVLTLGMSPGLLSDTLSYLFTFSVFLGAFNMIPVMPFDGAKILHWNMPIYIATLLVAGLLFFLPYAL